ncbi:MAG: hypothetical protein J7598_24090 [Mitsuaria chitosanitabida]|uniref:hypothetical protein n=1 Tax=Roseateles chitosanitabidus TaxID=65048 RepID=UPI001B23E1D6|nr:hypothetical protein [Roseateles chitosanitabidus]MBO9689694.1 hypothetical protein [Roseateles chitosanitabidus]
MTPSSRPTPPARPVALDTRTLGRPVHLLPQVALRLREALQRALVQPWNRRYHSRYELQALTLRPFAAGQDAAALAPSGVAPRWLRANGPAGPLACRIDRPLVLGLMARRLGLGADTALATADTPPTATEDRLLHLLAGQFAGLSLQWLALAARPEDEAEQDLTPLVDLPALQSGPLPTLNDAWTLTVAMRDMTPALPLAMPANASFKPEPAAAEPEADGAYEQADPAATPSGPVTADASTAAPVASPAQDMTLSLILDGAYLQPLLRRLSEQHRPARSGSAVGAPPLTRRLTLTLQARLLERELDLGSVLDLAPGALIPIRLADATVMVEGSALMSAAVAEHQGKLCLTSFQDLE